jgi:hypothetical protein
MMQFALREVQANQPYVTQSAEVSTRGRQSIDPSPRMSAFDPKRTGLEPMLTTSPATAMLGSPGTTNLS